MRIRTCLLTLLATTLCCLLIACGDDDNPVGPDTSITTFWRSYDLGIDDVFTSLTQSSGGTIVVGGSAEIEIVDSSGPLPVTDTNLQAVLVKCRPNGDSVWTTIFGADNTIEEVVLVTPSLGGYLTAARQGWKQAPGTDIILQQVSVDGVLGTGRTISQSEFDDVYDIRECSDGNFILSGTQGRVSTTGLMAYVTKVDQSGGLIWEKTFSHPDAFLRAQRIIELPDSTLLAAGIYNPSGSGVDLYVLRLSATGDSLYAVVVPMEGYNEVMDIAATPGGGYKILLYQENDQAACAIVRMDNLGAVTSIQYSFRSTYFHIEDGEFTPDGGAILCGKLGTYPSVITGLLIKLDASGLIDWEREFEDPDAHVYFNSVIDYSGGGYIIAGSRCLLLDDSYEGLLLRTDENGNVAEAP